jgi:hypothetical protein
VNYRPTQYYIPEDSTLISGMLMKPAAMHNEPLSLSASFSQLGSNSHNILVFTDKEKEKRE